MRIPGMPTPDDPPAPRFPLRPGVGAEVGRLQRQKVPPPKGRGVVLVLIGLALVYSVIHMFVFQKGAGGRAVKESVEERERPAIVPADRPETTRREPEPAIEVPAGLPVPLARDLLLAANALREEDDAARAMLAKLPDLANAAPEDKRSEVRTFLADRLARVALRDGLRREALEAALVLQPTAAEAVRLVATAVGAGLADDAAAPAALTYLQSYPDLGGSDALREVRSLVLDAKRPLALRVMAARALPREAVSDPLRALAEDESTPAPLRAALR